MNTAYVMQVIRTDLDLIGEGVQGDPCRRVIQFWTFEGKLLAEVDDWKESHNKEKMEKLQAVVQKYVARMSGNCAEDWELELFEEMKEAIK